LRSRMETALFNSQAVDIDSRYGKGFFPVRLNRIGACSFRVEGNWALASVKLDYLQATEPKPVYEWMNDLLFMTSISEKGLERQATSRDGFWNRILRKRKWAIVTWNEKRAQRHAEAVAERIAEAGKRDFRRHIDGLSNAVGGIIPSGWPLTWKHGLPVPRISKRHGRRIAAKPPMKAQEETNAHMRPFDRMRFSRYDQLRFKADKKESARFTDDLRDEKNHKGIPKEII
jgi:hypothetical protein